MPTAMPRDLPPHFPCLEVLSPSKGPKFKGYDIILYTNVYITFESEEIGDFDPWTELSSHLLTASSDLPRSIRA